MRSRIAFLTVITCVLFVAITNAPVFGQAPDSLSFQGYLTDSVGDPMDSSGVDITFNLYKGGSSVWMETQSVDVTNGVFHVYLGAVEPLDTVAFNQPIDLGIQVGADPEITPRTPLAASAFALGLRGLYVVAATNGLNIAPNLVGGAENNFVADGVVGATIGGGGGILLGGPVPDSVTALWGTVGGGLRNTASGIAATIGGGDHNTASDYYTTIGGGQGNTASRTNATVGGGSDNTASGGETTVGGGKGNTASGINTTIGGGSDNTASASRATVGGGQNNTASASRATVGGGGGNTASGGYTTVGGGDHNTASGNRATVPGGEGNTAGGYASFAAGYLAGAKHDGAFVWQDSTGSTTDTLSSTASNQFLARASGGFWLLTEPAPDTISGALITPGGLTLRSDDGSGIHFGSATETTWSLGPLTGDGTVLRLSAPGAAGPVMNIARDTGYIGFGTSPSTYPIEMASGAHVTSGGVWTDASSKTLKEDFLSVDPADVLERVADLPIQSWRYKREPDAVHMGPVAEDFYASFALGADDKHIAALDGNGVALAAIQGLYDLVKELQAENERMREAMRRAGIE